LFVSGLVSLSLDEYNGSSIRRQILLQAIALEVYKEQVRINGGQIK